LSLSGVVSVRILQASGQTTGAYAIPNSPPVMYTIDPVLILLSVDVNQQFGLTGTDAEGGKLRWQVEGLSSGLTFDADSQTLVGKSEQTQGVGIPQGSTILATQSLLSV